LVSQLEHIHYCHPAKQFSRSGGEEPPPDILNSPRRAYSQL
jgi:hypothetical protein